MTRRISILNVTPGAGGAGTFTIGSEPDNPTGNWVQVFRGQFYRDSAGNTSPSALAGYSLIKATTFQVIDNPSYAGTYSVFTQAGSVDSSVFGGGQTVVKVNQNLAAPINPAHLTTGYIVNVGTYYVPVTGGSAIVVPPTVSLDTLPVELAGRDLVGWGEGYATNMVRLAQTFAGSIAPPSPFVGQQWYSTVTKRVQVWNGTEWVEPGIFRFTQSVASSSWSITHNLGVPAPHVLDVSCYLDIGGGVFKVALPFDIIYNSSNQVTVTFSSPVTGIAILRA